MVADRHGEKILVLGAGNFGTCLAQHLAEKGYHVTMWSRSQAVTDSINASRKNPKYLSSINLSPRLSATSNLDAKTLGETSVVVHVTPTQTMREVLTQMKPHWRSDLLLICAAKGIEMGRLLLPHDIISDVLGQAVSDKAAFLSGPSFASEIVARQPTAVTVASRTEKSAHWAQELFHAAHFRVYTSDDPIGLEVAGALKNVVAIAAGGAAVTVGGALLVFIAITWLRGWKILWTEWLTSVDHKRIGVMYIVLALIMLLRGFVDALMMRAQQAMALNSDGYLPPEHFDQIFSSHGTIMIFFMAMPFMTGLMNLAVPLQIGRASCRERV